VLIERNGYAGRSAHRHPENGLDSAFRSERQSIRELAWYASPIEITSTSWCPDIRKTIIDDLQVHWIVGNPD
jgi:hypothetical protein